MSKQQDFNDAEARKADRFALIQKLGIEYAASFVPFSQSRNANEKTPSINWKVTVKKGNQSLTTDYMQGIAHISRYATGGKRRNTHADIYAINRSVENGVEYKIDAPTWAKDSSFKKQSAPELQDVLYSLISDSDALEYPTFEDWADNLGYDKDSLSGEKIYRACLETGLKLRAMLGDQNLTKLRELFQGY